MIKAAFINFICVSLTCTFWNIINIWLNKTFSDKINTLYKVFIRSYYILFLLILELVSFIHLDAWELKIKYSFSFILVVGITLTYLFRILALTVFNINKFECLNNLFVFGNAFGYLLFLFVNWQKFLNSIL